MTTKKTCKECGHDIFVQGKLGHGYANVYPIGKILYSSPMIVSFCKNCGEVSSIKVKDTSKF